jgi:hypothetical protein
MPSRKLTSHCHGCGSKNHLRAAYCNQCGSRLKEDRAIKDEDGRAKLYADIAHPINSACREMIQDRVIREFYSELDRAKLPGYVSRYDDIDLDDANIQMHGAHADSVPPAHHRPHAPREAASARESQHERPPARRPAAHDRTTIQLQSAEQHPRGPHQSPAARSTVHAPVGNATEPGGPSGAARPAAPALAAKTVAAAPNKTAGAAGATAASAGKPDSFGAGIF